MQKVFSARLEEAALDELDRAVKKAGISKRQFLEEAIHIRARLILAEDSSDVWAATCGAWSRPETPQETITTTRKAFREAFSSRRQ